MARTHESPDEDAASRLLRTDPRLQALSKKIRRMQDRLRSKISESAWQLYLRLDEVTNERCAELVEKLLKIQAKSDPRRRQP